MVKGTKFGIVVNRKLDTKPLPKFIGKFVHVSNSCAENDYAQLYSFMHNEWWYVVDGSLEPESNLTAI